MSYILDALRKSDQQRQRDLAPPPASPLSERTRILEFAGIPLWLRYGLPALALLALGILIGELRSGTLPAEVTVQPPPALQSTHIASEKTQTTIALAPSPASEKLSSNEKSMPSPREKAVASSPVVPEEMPVISITVHAYAEVPAERMARINGLLLHEGDIIAPGLKLQQITSDGVVLDFRGQRIRRKLY